MQINGKFPQKYAFLGEAAYSWFWNISASAKDGLPEMWRTSSRARLSEYLVRRLFFGDLAKKKKKRPENAKPIFKIFTQNYFFFVRENFITKRHIVQNSDY